MAGITKYPEPLVFGLDIGTRSIVGSVGYREGKQFNIVAQAVRFHDTRAMLDGQIHDIMKISEEIIEVKESLEEQLSGRKLKEVCIAAAGRVLKTAVGKGYYEFPDLTQVNQEYIHSIELMGIEEAHSKMVEENTTGDKYFCVGYSVIKYYMNGYEISNLEGHKVHNIAADVLATFLPEDVVDGLYAAVEFAGLEVANMTLEPIAAIQVAIPENYRLLNIALVDVGAGTSDISITKDGSIIGYGMLPKAGDELTEVLLKEYLCDFNTAETIKMISPGKKSASYRDILGIEHKVTPDEVYSKIEPTLDEITEQTAKKIIELNGGKPVAAAFVVGGGGKVNGYTEKLASHLGLPPERVGLRGEEVLGDINIMVEGVKKDPLLVTPIGICLNFYEQKNRFIYLTVNDERVKLYDNDKLTVFDAVLAFGLTNEDVFPKRGDDINYTLNGKKRFIRGEAGEPAQILLNDSVVGMNHEIAAGDKIVVEISTKGESASALLENVVDLNTTIKFIVNDIEITCPRFATVNNKLELGSYEIKDGDVIDVLNYYTLTQLMQFMDIETPHEVFVNGARANADTKIYENFNVAWIDREDIYKAQRFVEEEVVEEDDEEEVAEQTTNENVTVESTTDNSSTETATKETADKVTKESADETIDEESSEDETQLKVLPEEQNLFADLMGDTEDTKTQEDDTSKKNSAKKTSEGTKSSKKKNAAKKNAADITQNLDDYFAKSSSNGKTVDLHVTINGDPITLKGKSDYVFVDIFDAYDFDLKTVKGTKLVQTLDGNKAGHFEPIKEGSVIELYWKKD
ncbi:MAG: cell division protein FtsA [Lachnospiraceae bacterium]|nr:cell division protein FtsA [Lachnospiraceae bacterium]